MKAEEKLHLVQKRPPQDVVFEEGILDNQKEGGAKKNLFWRTWSVEPQTPKKGLVVIQHGFSEHGERYHHVASYLARRGFQVFSMDAQGHGRSEGKRGHVNRWDDYVDDLKIGIEHAQGLFPGLPTYLFGHSNGGLMTLRHALNHKGSIDAYIVSSPFCGFPTSVPTIQLKAAKILSKILPKLPIPIGIEAEKTTHHKDVIEDYKNDPLVFDKTTPRWVAETAKAQQDLKDRASEIKDPILFLVSAEDMIVDPKAAEEVYHALGSSKREFHLLPNMYHESLNEEGWEDKLEQVVEWISTMNQ